MKYTINIEEHFNKEFEVEANSVEEAMEIAQEKYYNEEFVLGGDAELTCKLMCVDYETEWTEF